MPTKKEVQTKSEASKMLDLAIFGLAVGVTVGAIALYIKSQSEKQQQ